MAFLPELNTFDENVYQIEETDLVLGGPDGISNKQARSLANRTNWLRKAQKGFNSITSITANATLSWDDVINKQILVSATVNIQLTLPTVDTQYIGARAFIQNDTLKNVTLIAPLRFDATDVSNIILAATETIELVLIGTRWLVRSFSGNLTSVGNTFYDYKERRNTLVCNGSLVARADYPRLWAFAQTLGSSLLTDVAWNGSPDNIGFFSSGNGSTTFRIPDLRGVFVRSLDLGSGRDNGRITEQPGGYEQEAFKQHLHPNGSLKFFTTQGSGGGQYGIVKKNPEISVTYWDLSAPNFPPPDFGGFIVTHYDNENSNTANAGGAETRPKNIGLIPLIKV